MHWVRSPLLVASLRPQPPRLAVIPQSGAQNWNVPCGQLRVVDEQTQHGFDMTQHGYMQT